MDSSLLETICDGDLDKLKKIPKITLTENITSLMVNKMKINKSEYIVKLHISNYGDGDLIPIVSQIKWKIKDIDNCIDYLKKIK